MKIEKVVLKMQAKAVGVQEHDHSLAEALKCNDLEDDRTFESDLGCPRDEFFSDIFPVPDRS